MRYKPRMHLTAPAIVLTVLPHGEHGAVVRFLTDAGALHAGYVRGGRSRRLRPVLQPGNSVALELRARVETQLAAATVELARSRAGLALDPLAAAALGWLTIATASALPEGAAHPVLHTMLDGLLDAMALSPAPEPWLAGIVRYELALLRELGFGLDLGSCAATGTTAELVYVSPKSAQAVSAAAGAPYAAKLLPLPGFLRGEAPGAAGIAEGLRLTGHFLERDLFTARAAPLLAARERLVTLAARRG